MRGPELPGRTCIPKTSYFQDKNLSGKLSSELLSTFKIFAGGNVPGSPPTGPTHLQNLAPKCKILNVFWGCPVIKGRTKQLELFNWLSNYKNVVLSNGFKNAQNVIQIALIFK